MDLVWVASPGAVSYVVKRSLTTGGPYAVIATNVTTTSFTDTNVLPNTVYVYVVSAVNPGGESANSNETNIALRPPGRPASLSAVTEGTQAILTWNVTAGATTYVVKRSLVSAGPYTVIATNVPSNSYADPTISPNTIYFYVVTAVNRAGESNPSLEAALSPEGPPAVPTGLSATLGQNGINLAWNVSPGAASYNVKRAVFTGGPYGVIASGVTANSFTDSSVLPNTTYFYLVSAVKIGSNGAILESKNSVEVNATTPSGPPVPTGLTILAGNNQAFLNWNVSAGATSYGVKRGVVKGGPYGLIASNLTSTSFVDSSLTPATVYFYVVFASNGFGPSGDSAEVTLTAQTPPGTPTGLTGTAGDQQVVLSWNGSLGAASYNVKRGTTPGGPYTTVATVANTAYTDQPLTPNTTYFYVVTAVRMSGNQPVESPNSNEANATTPKARPRLSISRQGSNVVISWNALEAYVLESSDTLGPTASWHPAGSAAVAGQNTVILPISGARAFFRLRFP